MLKTKLLKFVFDLFGKLIFLGLVVYFIIKATTSILKLLDEDIGTMSKSTYSKLILFPSITVCKDPIEEWTGEKFPLVVNISDILFSMEYPLQIGNRYTSFVANTIQYQPVP
jgi:hypothetical protein